MLLFQHPAALLFLFACAGPSADADQAAYVAAAESSSLPAQQTPAGPPELELPRHPALSPDASQVAFSHQGDLWVAPVEGGRAVRLTAHDAYDGRPKWSPDGQSLAFVSNRHGNWDVYTMPVWGGTPERLTWHSEGERLYQWLDSERLLMGAQRDRRYSRRDRGAWIAYTDGRTPTVMGDWAIMAASVSQDGNTMVYERGHGDPARRAYRGPANSSLWTYDVASASHVQITETDGNDLAPMLSPDGETTYFLSDRACAGNEGGRDLGLWKMPTQGGRARLVYHPGGRSLRNAALSQNGAEVVAELDLGLVRIATQDGAMHPLPVFGSIDPSDPLVHDRTVSSGASEIAVSPDGESIAFVSAGDVYVMRKHEDIKRCVRVTTHPAPDYSPVWLEDGEELLFISERDGNAEFYIAEVPDGEEQEESTDEEGQDSEEESSDGDEDEDDEKEEGIPFYMSRSFEIERITQTDADESSPALSPDGKTLAWVVGLGDLVVGDPETAAIQRTLTTGFDAPDFDWSPDSAWLVYSKSDNDFNIDVFLQRVDVEGLDASEPGVEPYNLTVHPDDDYGPVWSPDGRHILFTSRRMMLDETDVWMVHLRAEDQEMNKQERLEAEEAKKKAAKAKKADKPKGGASTEPGEIDALLTGTWECAVTGPDPIPPTGMPVSFRFLKVGDAMQGEMESMMFSSACSAMEWDAQSGVLKFVMNIPEGPEGKVELTLSGDDLNGMAIVEGDEFPITGKRTSALSGLEDEDFAMEDEGASDDANADLQEDVKEESDETEEDAVIIDWTDLRHRVVRMTRREGNESALGWSADSEKLYFNASTGTRLTNGTSAETGFFSLEIDGGKEDKVESTPVNSLTHSGKDLFYVKSGRIVSKGKTYNFSLRYREDLRDVREAVIGEVWRALDRNFYDPGFHGHDWAASLAKWGPAARAASTREDYGEMVNWMLGEMNASHMGYYGFGASAARETDAPGMGLLGVLWDESHAGDGRRVREVLAGTPAARSISQLQEGDLVLAVNGENYGAGDNWYRLMSGTAGRPTFLTIQNPEGESREVTIRPTSSLNAALYRNFEDVTRARVEEASAGRLGYIHIESMSTGPLVEFERDLFAAGAGKDGLVIDVRENGGGWTTDMILAMLEVRDHAITIPRGGGEGYPQGRRVFATWDKPIVVLCNENSYSNAEIFSWSIKTLGRGPLVGKATFGAVISTGGTGLMDGSFVRIPFRGWYVNDENHTNMELNGCPVDYPVENLPGDGLQGLDRQLEKAIEVGLKQL